MKYLILLFSVLSISANAYFLTNEQRYDLAKLIWDGNYDEVERLLNNGMDPSGSLEKNGTNVFAIVGNPSQQLAVSYHDFIPEFTEKQFKVLNLLLKRGGQLNPDNGGFIQRPIKGAVGMLYNFNAPQVYDCNVSYIRWMLDNGADFWKAAYTPLGWEGAMGAVSDYCGTEFFDLMLEKFDPIKLACNTVGGYSASVSAGTDQWVLEDTGKEHWAVYGQRILKPIIGYAFKPRTRDNDEWFDQNCMKD